jgi:hypothetical protein
MRGISRNKYSTKGETGRYKMEKPTEPSSSVDFFIFFTEGCALCIFFIIIH